MSDISQPTTGIPQRIMGQPMICAECGLQIGLNQLADECELCGAPRCRACAAEAGGNLASPYICSACAAEE